MSIFDNVKTTLTSDLKIAESDAKQIAGAMIGAGEQSFSSILDTVVQNAKARPLGEVLDGAFKIYQHIHAEKQGATPTSAQAS